MDYIWLLFSIQFVLAKPLMTCTQFEKLQEYRISQKITLNKPQLFNTFFRFPNI